MKNLRTKLVNGVATVQSTTRRVLHNTAESVLGGVHLVATSTADLALHLECKLNKDVDPEQVMNDRIMKTKTTQLAIMSKVQSRIDMYNDLKEQLFGRTIDIPAGAEVKMMTMTQDEFDQMMSNNQFSNHETV